MHNGQHYEQQDGNLSRDPLEKKELRLARWRQKLDSQLWEKRLPRLPIRALLLLIAVIYSGMILG